MGYNPEYTKTVIQYPKATAEHIKIIQRYYHEVDGVKLPKSEVFRRAVLILANEIKKSEEKAKDVR